MPDYTPYLQAIAEQRLPADFINTVEQWYLPLASEIAKQHRQASDTMLLGINGSQGSGKSTLAAFLQLILQQQYQLTTAVLSLDDFYLTRAERKTLAKKVHPLLATRGVPGTHDVVLALDTFTQLFQLSSDETTRLPSFDKSIDDRAAHDSWPAINGPLEIIIFEGWCVGATAQTQSELAGAVNQLEAEEDADGLWRHYVNDQLESVYPSLFARLDHLIMLKAPSFNCVYEWRLLQETKLRNSFDNNATTAPTQIMDEKSILRFISHYQRITEHCLKHLPYHCDWLLQLDQAHQVTSLTAPMQFHNT